MKQLKILPYHHKYRRQYIELSLEWLNKYDLLEDIDKIMLQNPKEHILDKGGYIFLAHYSNNVVGTITLKKSSSSTFEILKLGVNGKYQGLGIGRKLMQHSIELSKNKKANKIILETNTKLSAAIALYKKLNFKEIPLGNSEYNLSNYKMELILDNQV